MWKSLASPMISGPASSTRQFGEWSASSTLTTYSGSTLHPPSGPLSSLAALVKSGSRSAAHDGRFLQSAFSDAIQQHYLGFISIRLSATSTLKDALSARFRCAQWVAGADKKAFGSCGRRSVTPPP